MHLRTHPRELTPLVSSSSALSTHLTAPSLQAAATRGPGPRPGLSESSSQIARDMYLQGEHSHQVEPAVSRQDSLQRSQIPRHTPMTGKPQYLVSGSTLIILCLFRCRSQYSSSRWDERCMTWQARRLGVLASGVTMMLKQCISARPPADTT